MPPFGAFWDEAGAAGALRSRVVDYVIKPFNINQLYKLVEPEDEPKEKDKEKE